MEIISSILADLLSVVMDCAPILAVILFFQFVVLRKGLPNPHKLTIGFAAVIVGLYLFLVGLDMGIFPIGKSMATSLSTPDKYIWTMLFAFCIGYSTAMAEPALLAVAQKAEEISSGGLPSFYLRNTVAIGVAVGLALGVHRIFSGDPLWIYILCGYLVTIGLTFIAPKEIVPLAYDLGGVTTSTITVPLVAALGIGLASNIPGRDPLIDGFGLIAFAAGAPMISVLGYAVISEHLKETRKRKEVTK